MFPDSRQAGRASSIHLQILSRGLWVELLQSMKGKWPAPTSQGTLEVAVRLPLRVFHPRLLGFHLPRSVWIPGPLGSESCFPLELFLQQPNQRAPEGHPTRGLPPVFFLPRFLQKFTVLSSVSLVGSAGPCDGGQDAFVLFPNVLSPLPAHVGLCTCPSLFPPRP